MKRIFWISLMLLGVMAFTPAQAQVKFGVKGGFNLASLSLKGDFVNSSNKTGFYIGPTLKIGLPLPGLSFDASALYNQVSTDVTVDVGNEQIVRSDQTIDVKQIAIPLNLRYGVGLGSMASLFFFAGPQFAFNMSDDISNIDWKWKNAYTSMNLGAGVTLLGHLQLHLNYNVGLSNVGESHFGSNNYLHGKSNAWQVGAAYYF